MAPHKFVLFKAVPYPGVAGDLHILSMNLEGEAFLPMGQDKAFDYFF